MSVPKPLSVAVPSKSFINPDPKSDESPDPNEEPGFGKSQDLAWIQNCKLDPDSNPEVSCQFNEVFSSRT